jgi:hypothetical protein
MRLAAANERGVMSHKDFLSLDGPKATSHPLQQAEGSLEERMLDGTRAGSALRALGVEAAACGLSFLILRRGSAMRKLMAVHGLETLALVSWGSWSFL